MNGPYLSRLIIQTYMYFIKNASSLDGSLDVDSKYSR